MKVRYDLADVGSMEPLPKDWYTAHIIKSEYKMSKASNQPMFTVDWEVDEGEYAGRKINYDNISLSPKAAFMVNDFLEACKVERECTECHNTFTEGKRVTREESKINKAGLACPSCGSQAPVEWDAGDPPGQAMVGWRCMIGVTIGEPNEKGQQFNSVEGYAPIK